MDDRDTDSLETTSAETPESYEPPIVEDLDSSYGPSVTAAGGPSVGKAAPRDL